MITEALLDLVACPNCRGRISPSKDGTGLQCVPCAATYPILDGIPVLLINEVTVET